MSRTLLDPIGPFGYPLNIPWYWTLGWTLLLHILLLFITPLVCSISTWQLGAQDMPEQFCHWVKQKSQIFHQLLLQNNIDKAKVIEVFVTEESNHLYHSNQSAMLANRQIAPSILTQTPSKWCNFCDLSTHNTDTCFSLANAKSQIWSTGRLQSRRRSKGRRTRKHNRLIQEHHRVPLKDRKSVV